MKGIDERSPLGNRILHLAQQHSISDFYRLFAVLSGF